MDLSLFISDKDDSRHVAKRRLNIVIASSEVAPYSKRGGMADVAASLPKALAKRGHTVILFTPLYGNLDPQQMRLSRRLFSLEVPTKSKHQAKVEATLWETRLPQGGRIVFVDAPDYFDRPGIYGDDQGPFEDNAQRFAFFSRAAVEYCRLSPLPIDILHCHDWTSALAPIYARHYYEDEFGDMAIALTIHDLSTQGTFDVDDHYDATGLPQSYKTEAELLDASGQLNFLKGGLIHSDTLTTVSQGYADDLMELEDEAGLHTILAGRGDLKGILNGADYSVWSPDIDRHIAVQYDIDTLNGKRQNKAKLQHDLGLPIRPTLPLVGVVGELSTAKGTDVLIPAVRTLLSDADGPRDGFQLVVLGEGDEEMVAKLNALVDEFPQRVAIDASFSEQRAHAIQAGADILAIPSRSEPCGLTQLYAMRYGTIPVVHETGGLADSVADLRDDPDKGTGFTFSPLTEDTLAGALDRSSSAYRNYRKWRPLMVRAMERDFSWGSSARRFEEVFFDVLNSDDSSPGDDAPQGDDAATGDDDTQADG